MTHLAAMTAAAGLLLIPVLAASQPNTPGSSKQTETTTQQGPLSGQSSARDVQQGRSEGVESDPTQRGGPSPEQRAGGNPPAPMPNQGAAPSPTR